MTILLLADHGKFTVKALRGSKTKPDVGIVDWLAETFDESEVRVVSATVRNLVLRDPQRLT